jgi:hypothetical protein
VKKILLFLLVAAVIAWLEPRSRAQILKLVRPVTDAGRSGSAQIALKRIALDVERSVAQTGSYPQPDAFERWLEETQYSPRDPWGSPYYLEVFPDSFVVGSRGPDSKMRTADDVRVARRREPTAAGLGSAYTPPAPPSSGVKSRAIRKARELQEK